MPRDLFAENGINPGAQQGGVDLFAKNNINPNEKLVTQPSQAQTMSAGDQFLNGAGDALVNTYTAGLADPQRGAGFAYGAGKVAGNIGGFVGGGELLDSLRLAAKGLPYIGKVAGMLEGGGLQDATRRALGSAAYGADTNPDDRLGGAEKGALFSGSADSVAGGAKFLARGSEFFRPQKYMQKLMNDLSGGMGLEENNQSLAQDIKKSYEQKFREGNDLYKPVFDGAGNSRIYSGGWQGSPNSSYGSLNKDLFNSYTGDLKDFHSNFVKEPTLQNAHDLQSQLGYSIRNLDSKRIKSGLSSAEVGELQGYVKARGALKSDINNFLFGKDPNLSVQYNKATSNWDQNVVPYLENSKISQIAKGGIENPRNVADIFRNPESDIKKVSEDMGPDAARKILFSELGKHGPSSKPEKLLEAFQKLDQQGLGSYVTPKLSDQLDSLAARVKARNGAQIGAGGLTGALLGGHLATGIPLAEGIGTGLGALLGYGARKLPSAGMGMPSSKFLMNLTRGSYRPLSQAVLSNVIPGDQ